MEPALVPPPIQIEGRSAVIKDAMRLDDVLLGGEQPLQEVRGVLDHVDVQPQDPVLIVERMKQQMIAALRQDRAPLDLMGLRAPVDPERQPVPEVAFPEADAAELAAEGRQVTL